MKSNTIAFFDIETGPLPDEQLALVKPEFKAPANYKDEEKIKAYLVEAEAKWKQDAALSALTGQVLLIGTMQGGIFDAHMGEEKQLLTEFWMWLDTMQLALSHTICGFSILNFDLPFLVQRSYLMGVSFPWAIRKGRYWSEHFVDLAELWACGSREKMASLDTLARSMGLGAKTGHGADFAKLFSEDREKAVAYCENDLRLTAAMAERMGIV